MSLIVKWERSAIKDMRRLSKDIQDRITKGMAKFALDASVGDVKRLKGFDPPEFRLRIGDWRIIFTLEDGEIRVLQVGPRGGVYKS